MKYKKIIFIHGFKIEKRINNTIIVFKWFIFSLLCLLVKTLIGS